MKSFFYYHEMHSLITPVPRNGKVESYESHAFPGLDLATNTYLKEACDVNSFNFFELDSAWIVGSFLNTLLFKNDHLHLTKLGYEKLSLQFVSQLNLVLGKVHETPQEPECSCRYRSVVSFTLNKAEFSTLLSV